MKPNYKNWMPKGFIYLGVGLSLILFLITSFTKNTLLFTFFMFLTVAVIIFTIRMIMMYRAFSYDGKRQLSKKIIDIIADYVKIPNGGKGLDVGCGSGALTIACAKRNKKAHMIGIDRWGKDYASFNKELCENNAKAENVHNVSFAKGDATKLDFEDQSFDVVTSNYVYHNIAGVNRQEVVLETLRVLKKGGTFVIHDIMTKSKYGDVNKLIDILKDQGYEDVRLINVIDPMFSGSFEMSWLDLNGSKLLVGKK